MRFRSRTRTNIEAALIYAEVLCFADNQRPLNHISATHERFWARDRTATDSLFFTLTGGTTRRLRVVRISGLIGALLPSRVVKAWRLGIRRVRVLNELPWSLTQIDDDSFRRRESGSLCDCRVNRIEKAEENQADERQNTTCVLFQEFLRTR